jgi:hypothetical protein
LVARVSLIGALGDGWDVSQLPTKVELAERFSLLPKLVDRFHISNWWPKMELIRGRSAPHPTRENINK